VRRGLVRHRTQINPPLLDHEVHRGRRCLLRGDNQVPSFSRSALSCTMTIRPSAAPQAPVRWSKVHVTASRPARMASAAEAASTPCSGGCCWPAERVAPLVDGEHLEDDRDVVSHDTSMIPRATHCHEFEVVGVAPDHRAEGDDDIVPARRAMRWAMIGSSRHPGTLKRSVRPAPTPAARSSARQLSRGSP